MTRIAIALVFVLPVASLLACSSPRGRRVLTFFFDGVPEKEAAPDEEPTAAGLSARPLEIDGAPVVLADLVPDPDLPSASDLVRGGFSAVDALTLRPVPRRTGESWQPTGAPLEKVESWEQAVAILPRDQTWGVDWVAALKQGLYLPQQVLKVDATAPFTLDSLRFAAADLPASSPFLDFDVEMVPEEEPFFAVSFPHSSHTLFLGCSSCHPGVQEWDLPMEGILGGEACGSCHGKVSFPLETGCPRCHRNLAFPAESVVEEELERARREPPLPTAELAARGEVLYGQYCELCHGGTGDGKGRLARLLTTKPRDFTSGKFKIRSTLGQDPPTDLDLFRSITRGIPRTSMPAWSALSYEDRWALVLFVKSFSAVFAPQAGADDEPVAVAEAGGPDPLAIPDPPPESAELLAEGAKQYKLNGCDACHGTALDGNGTSAATLKDDWGNPVRPYDFSSGTPPKGGERVQDFYRVIMTGFAGTPMPGFATSLAQDAVWALARYVMSVRNTKPAPLAVTGDIPFYRNGIGPDGKPAPVEAAAAAAVDDPFGDDPFADDPFGEPAATDPDDPFAEPPASDADDPFASPAPADPDDPFAEPAAAHEDLEPQIFEYPPAVFPHWFHRVRLKCSNCHPQVFTMKAGANPISMDGMRAGLHCAKCHNGAIAFEIGFETCHRCHQERVAP